MCSAGRSRRQSRRYDLCRREFLQWRSPLVSISLVQLLALCIKLNEMGVQPSHSARIDLPAACSIYAQGETASVLTF